MYRSNCSNAYSILVASLLEDYTPLYQGGQTTREVGRPSPNEEAVEMDKLSWRTKLMGLFAFVLGGSMLFQVRYMILSTRSKQVEMTKANQEEIALP